MRRRCTRAAAGILACLATIVARADWSADDETAIRTEHGMSETALRARLESARDPLERARIELALAESPHAAADAAERLAQLDAIVARREALLDVAGRSEPPHPALPLWACEQARDLLVTRASGDGGLAFVLVGVLDDNEIFARRADLAKAQSAMALAHRAIAATTNGPLHASIEGMLPPLDAIVVASARSLHDDASANLDATEMATVLEERAGEWPPLRDASRLSVASLALAARNEELARRAISLVTASSDATMVDRTAARALTILADAARDPQAAARKATRLGEELALGQTRGDLTARLLAADAAHRVIGSDPDASLAARVRPWTELHASLRPAERIALRGPLLARCRGALAGVPRDELASLPLLAIAAAVPPRAAADPLAVDAFAAVVDRSRNEPAYAIALHELARSLALAGRYREAAERFRAFATDGSDDPLSPEAIELAIEIDSELAAAAGFDGPAADALAADLDVATARFPYHPKRVAWRVSFAELALERGQFAAAREAIASVPPSAPEAAAARVLDTRVCVAQASRTADPAQRSTWLEAAKRSAELARSGGSLDQTKEATLLALESRTAFLRGEYADAAMLALRVATNVALPPSIRADAIDVLLSTSPYLPAESTRIPDPVRSASADSASFLPVLLVHLRRACAAAEGDDAVAAAAAVRLLRDAAPVAAEFERAGAPEEARLLVARALLVGGHPREAQVRANGLLREDPDNPAAILIAAESTLAIGEPDAASEASALYRRALEIVPERSPRWWDAQLGQLRALARFPEVGPDDLRARVNRLRAVDPELGGVDRRLEFERIERGDA